MFLGDFCFKFNEKGLCGNVSLEVFWISFVVESPSFRGRRIQRRCPQEEVEQRRFFETRGHEVEVFPEALIDIN